MQCVDLIPLHIAKLLLPTVLANTSVMSYNYDSFSVVRAFKIYYLSNFQIHTTILLTIITMMYIRSPELIQFLPFGQHLIFPSLQPVFLSLAFLDSTYE